MSSSFPIGVTKSWEKIMMAFSGCKIVLFVVQKRVRQSGNSWIIGSMQQKEKPLYLKTGTENEKRGGLIIS